MLSRLKSLVTKDVTRVFAARVSQLQRQSDSTVQVRMLSAAEILPYCEDPVYDISVKSAKCADLDNHYFGATFQGETLTAYTFFATFDLAPEFNSAGKGFGGIGMKMPDNVLFLYKGFALPQHRGKNQLMHTILHGADTLINPDGWVFTTTDVNNHSSSRLLTKLGFAQQETLSEYCAFGIRHYRIPGVVQLGAEARPGSRQVELYTP